MYAISRFIRNVKTKNRNQIGLFLCFLVLCLLALGIRYKLASAVTFDYINFLKPWHDYLARHGLHSFHDNFANYNTPYLFLLWLTTHLPLGTLTAVKGISIIADFGLAVIVAAIVGHFKQGGYMKYVAFLTVLFMPTVLMNGSLWGQCDAIYTIFNLWAFYYVLKNRPGLAWTLWGVALGFKLQAIFFLPFLVFVTLQRRWKMYVPAYAIISFCILSCLPVLEGRSIMSTLDIYINQAKDPVGGQQVLSWYSATLGQLFPAGGVLYSYFKDMLLTMAVAVSIGLVSLAFVLRRVTEQQLVILMTASLFVLPFLLPGIHERYSFSAEIAALICAFIVPRLSWVVIAMQIVSIQTYDSYFTEGSQKPILSYGILSLGVLAIIYGLGRVLQDELIPLNQFESNNALKGLVKKH